MAQLNITLDQDEILALLANDPSEAFRALLERAVNGLLKTESAEQLRAGRYERNAERTDSRNGTRTRMLTTRIGTLELIVPRHRNVPFHTMVFENYKRSEAAVVTTMAEMVVAGVSTAKVSRVIEELCGKKVSKQQVSQACRILEDAVAEFRARPLEPGLPFVMVDATVLKVRENHRIVPKVLMIALALTEEGKKEIIGFDLADRESAETWTAFLSGLRARGLSDPAMFASDSHEGITAALSKVYPNVPWQRCQAHFSRNVAQAAPKGLRAGLRSELAEMFNCPTLAQAEARRDQIAADYRDVAPDAVECLENGFADAMTVMALPAPMRRAVRTTNYLERLNREVKRRSKVVTVFPNAQSVLRIVGSYLIEENDRWHNAAKLYYKPACRELDQRRGRLAELARTQQTLRKAA